MDHHYHYVYRSGSRIEEPRRGRQARRGVEGASWLNMDCTVQWSDIPCLFPTRLCVKQRMTNVLLLGSWVMITRFDILGETNLLSSSGMHRKSMEAAQTLSHDIIKQKGYDDDGSGSSSEDEEIERKPKIDADKDEFRSSSIAALRAKAQEHSAKMFSSFERGEHLSAGKMLSLQSGGGTGHEVGSNGHYISAPDTQQQSVF